MLLYKTVKFTDLEEITSELLAIARELNPEIKLTANFGMAVLEQRVPKLIKQFEQLNLDVNVFREFTAEPGGGLPIHMDGPLENPRHWALNWPIEHTSNTQMVWWTINEGAVPARKIEDPGYGNNYIEFYNNSDATEIDSLEILEPTLVNVNVHHSIRNPNTTHRRMISFRFGTEPYHMF